MTMYLKGNYSLQLAVWLFSICLFIFSFFNYLNKMPLKLESPQKSNQSGPQFQNEWNKRFEGQRLSCEVLLSNGSAVCQEDNPSALNCSTSEKIWKPDGCDMHVHTFSELGICIAKLNNKKMYMMGDSRIRHIYDSFKSRLKGLEYSRKMQIWQDMIYRNKKKGLALKFYWRPFVNNETLQTLMELNKRGKRPAFLILGNALHTIWNSNGTLGSTNSYSTNFTKMVPILDELASRTKVLWMTQPPVIHPFTVEDNVSLKRYNDIANQHLKGTHVRVMHSTKRIGELTLDAYTDGCHLGEEANRMIVEILLNFICNEHINTEENICCDEKSKSNF